MQLLDTARLKADRRPAFRALQEGWQLLGATPGQFAQPADLPAEAGWISAPVLGPVADVLQQVGQWSLDGPPRRFDAEDWWYRLRFDLAEGQGPSGLLLHLDGLATVADIWLNGQLILSSTDMFLAHRCEVGQILQASGNELVMVFRSLDEALSKRRPRPRWRAPMIENQQLRWFRTTLLGRTPGWSPPAAVVGPWRGVWLSESPQVELAELALQPRVQGADGRLSVNCTLNAKAGAQLEQVTLILSRQGQTWQQNLSVSADGRWQGDVLVSDVALWWPHTHGEPALYECALQIVGSGQMQALTMSLGAVGFRTIELDQSGDGFALRVNGVPVFCRGACWTPLDAVRLDAPDRAAYEEAIAQVRRAGMNMVRVGGTMSYEADAFYDECDRQGVLVWQELMFANMDYPEEPAFVALAQEEVHQQCQRWQGRPALAVLCGNSEVEQQAAMFGATRDRWVPALFHDTLAQVCRERRPDVPYWPSSAHGGAFPHQGDVGTTSYYGVGAYMRALDDARRAQVRFATECLAFSNAPEPDGLAAMPGGLSLRMHHPAWKARAPRDLGAGWDFEDVRDHYVAQLFDVDPGRLRYSDHDRYLALGRVAVGEVMSATFAEWRRAASVCQGAMIWFLRDLWPGAGWGVVDSLGQPKAPYYYLKRALQPLSIALTDEGGNGLFVHATNETAEPIKASVEVTAWRHGATQVGQGVKEIELSARSAQSWPLMSWFDWFADWSFAYRFGPLTAQVLVAVLRDENGRELARAHAFPGGLNLPVERDLGLQATAGCLAPGYFEVTLVSARFAQSVHWDVDGISPDDAYFHLSPGETRTLRVNLRGKASTAQVLSGGLRALNLDGQVSIQMESGPSL
ncbi:MAG TPA: glycoside hydrolase family 2 protein [Aquabacterium sp.]|uniref:glycoside hydrolase family 2 protein n=1 Tax=Aquabacterium sp. TaxID=1872578 RepID=UPI002E3685E3|nr:glycoside hydrolase family 2 protein [Aquabacterium sp.]HEX5355200.1 glycoside hydrolase family 2 protein [Aquabacterium sp.]